MKASFFFCFVCFVCGAAMAQAPFITTWQTDNPGPSDDQTIAIPLAPDESYDFTIDWGDGVEENYMGFGDDLVVAHTYASPGLYSVAITGIFPQIYFSNIGDKDKIVSIEQWGDIAWNSFRSAFEGCSQLHINADDAPDLSSVTSMREVFRMASSINESINHWDVSNVVNMRESFASASAFNQPLNQWEVGSVADFSSMFYSATAFNQDLSGWDVSTAETLSGMFGYALAFNQPLNTWDVSNVTDFSWVFGYASSFNQPLDAWDVSSATTMSEMFIGAASFNQPLESWVVTNVTEMTSMFEQATSFNQPIGNWDVSGVTNMVNMFQEATSFNQPLNDWDVSGVERMHSMFTQATSFDQPLDNWDLSGLNDPWNGLLSMFFGATKFNQPLNSWDVSNVTNMWNMFREASAFNQPLDNWDVSNVESMEYMFLNASSFNQSLANWDMTAVWNVDSMLSYSGLAPCNYDATLIGWAQQDLNPSQNLGAEGLQYTWAGEAARNFIINNEGWSISGDAFVELDELTLTGSVEGTEISVSAAGGTGNYTYSWSGPGGFSSSDSVVTVTENGVYTVTVFDGCTETSQTFEILTVGIQDTQQTGFQLFPNPARDRVCITDLQPTGEVQVMDAAGRIVYREAVNAERHCINVSHLARGIYVVRYSDGGWKMGRKRLVMQ